ncbi:MAG: HAD-IIIA family hydrolase [Candidatus Omnitrophica bacterium]|nr:HAD-IIIA family hydrolase [Candidatus Omnitrophota bacterium]
MSKILERFKRVKLLVLDVDGVLTKGEIIYDNQDKELKIFNVKDGLSVFLLNKVGINTIFLTAKNSKVVRKRAKDMGVREVIGGILPKSKAIEKIKKKYKLKKDEICFIGDDLIDISAMKRVGLPIAVRDAPREVKSCALYVTKNRGGEGAVREVVEHILKAKNLWKKIVEEIDTLIDR